MLTACDLSRLWKTQRQDRRRLSANASRWQSRFLHNKFVLLAILSHQVLMSSQVEAIDYSPEGATIRLKGRVAEQNPVVAVSFSVVFSIMSRKISIVQIFVFSDSPEYRETKYSFGNVAAHRWCVCDRPLTLRRSTRNYPHMDIFPMRTWRQETQILIDRALQKYKHNDALPYP